MFSQPIIFLELVEHTTARSWGGNYVTQLGVLSITHGRIYTSFDIPNVLKLKIDKDSITVNTQTHNNKTYLVVTTQ